MRKNYENIILIFMATIILLIPLYFREFTDSQDAMFHVANISATVETMDDFIPDDISPLIAYDYGYATRQFYPPLAHTTASYVVKTTGVSVITAIKITYTIVLFLSGVTMYYLALKLSNNKRLALASGIIYMAFPYHLSDIYMRNALSEAFVFIFLPMIISSLFELFKNKRKFIILFVIGYVGGMLSHFTLMLYFTFCLIPFFIINYKKVFNKKTILTLCIAAAFILTLTSPYLANMIQNKFFGDYMVFFPEHMAQGIWHSGVILQDMFNYSNVFTTINSENNIHMYCNIIVLILLIITIIRWKKLDVKDTDKNHKFLLIFGIVSLVMASQLFPWDYLPNIFRMIQFPWRMLTFVAIPVAIFAPICLKNISIKKPIIFFAILASILGLALFDTGADPDSEVVDLNNIGYSYGMGWQKEYLPVNTYNNYNYFETRKYGIIIDRGSTSIVNDELGDLTFTVDTDDKALIELPRLYYLGYELKDSNGNKFEIYNNEFGFIATEIPSGSYTLKYTRTVLVNSCYVLAGISLIIFAIYVSRKELYGKD